MCDALRSMSLRLTPQRLETAREIAQSDTHPDAETVYRNVQGRISTISLDTVYRTLGTLARLGVVGRVEAISGPTRYDANLERHHHFVCTQCGSIKDVYSPVLDGVGPPEQTDELGVVQSVRVQLRGVCKTCQRKENLHG